MTTIKVFTSQATSFSLYKNLRTKVVKCWAKIYFNKQRLEKGVPKYAHIKIPNMSPASHITSKSF